MSATLRRRQEALRAARNLLFRRRMHEAKRAGLWLATMLALWPSAARAAETSELPPLEWRSAVVGLRAKGVAALAAEPGTGRLAVGDEQGVLIGRPGRPFRRVLYRGPVLDLAFLAEGALLAATERGLYRIEGDAGGVQLGPGPGEGARSVRRIAAIAGLVAVATDDGIFVSRDTRVWQRLTGALPGGAATAVALRRRGEVAVCWGVFDGELWRVGLSPDAGALVATAAVRETIPFAIRGAGAVDIATDLPGASLVVVFPQSLALLRGDTAGERWELLRPQLPAAAHGDERWELLRPQLPPGASALRLGRGAGRSWLATDRGLLEAAQLAGPWRRTSPPVGSSAVQAAAGVGDELFAAVSDGVLAGRPPALTAPLPDATLAAATEPLASLAVPADPAIERVHRAALRYLGLTRSRTEALRRGAQRRAWWPIVAMRAGGEWDDSRSTDRDQSFLSGDTRYLTDRERDRGEDFGVSLSLSWDLGGVAYEPESIDVSRETREVIELRDDVLDEITQLYFERRRVLAELGAPIPPPAAEQRRLRLRAAELAAGIDAWTGGWFSRQVPALAP
jgi:hypothetical protein